VLRGKTAAAVAYEQTWVLLCDIMLIQVKCPNTVQFYSFMGPLVVQLEEQQLDTFFSLPLTYQVA
jgi:hypothetical protein